MLASRRAFLRALLGSIVASWAMIVGLPLWAGRATRRRSETSGLGGYIVREGRRVYLPYPEIGGVRSLEWALASRRSLREYSGDPLTVGELAQILWAAYGITETRYGFKTTPSAGGTYPLVVYSVVSERGVTGYNGYLEPGSYRYDPASHSMVLVRRGDFSRDLYYAAVKQEWVLRSKVVLVFTAVFERTTGRYGERGVRYVWMEVGHSSQNVYLQATSLGLGTVAIGAFFDEEVRRIIGAPEEERVLYLMALARPRRTYSIGVEELKRFYEYNRAGLGGEA